MFHIQQPTEQWIDEVVNVINENQLKPEESKFMMAFFSSMDSEFLLVQNLHSSSLIFLNQSKINMNQHFLQVLSLIRLMKFRESLKMP